MYRRELPKKGGLDGLHIQGGTWRKRESGVFEKVGGGGGGGRGDTPMHTMNLLLR